MWLFTAIVLILGFTTGCGPVVDISPSLRGSAEWTMVDVNRGIQGDAHLLSLPDGSFFIIDTGYEATGLSGFLKARGIDVVNTVLITHPHKDHYGELALLRESGLQIRTLFANTPERGKCDSEIPWGCDFNHFLRILELWRGRGAQVRPLRNERVLYAEGRTRLTVLYAHDGTSPPVGDTDINDLSLVILFEHGPTRVLFTGDLNRKLGAYLARRGGVRADILKVPHHGTESLAPNEFFDAVAPSVALVPSPARLWRSERSRRTREYLERRGIPTFVNGVHGHVTVRFTAEGFTVTPERGKGIQMSAR